MSFISLKSQIGDILVRIVDIDSSNFILEVKRTPDSLPSTYKLSMNCSKMDELLRFYSVIIDGILVDSRKADSFISSRGIKILYDGASLDLVLLHQEESIENESWSRRNCL